MTISLSPQQIIVAEHPLEPLSVMACAGSGKTFTAVHRLIKMQSLVADRHCVLALLSFSNVAVETFRRDFALLTKNSLGPPKQCGVEIDTVDGFITKYILRPHAHRAMKCGRTPFLVNGSEPFLDSFKFYDGARNQPTAKLIVNRIAGDFSFKLSVGHRPANVTKAAAILGIERLGTVGAYTHEMGRYWAYRTLKEQPYVLRALARRFPHILVDEAQDIGSAQQSILELMIEAGVQLSLIGDLNQGIFEFSGADGSFLSTYHAKANVKSLDLTVNYRSVPAILRVANNLSGRTDTPDPNRVISGKLTGALYLPYHKDRKDDLRAAFSATLLKAGINSRNAVILCRSAELTSAWSGESSELGQGTVKLFAQATVHRDGGRRNDRAFQLVVHGLVRLLDDSHGDLGAQILRPMQHREHRSLRQAIWAFVRDRDIGLPSGTKLADTEWHAALKPRVLAFLGRLRDEFGLVLADNLGNKLAKTALSHAPLVPDLGLIVDEVRTVRVSTVHQVKGESIDAVMYIGSRGHVRDLLDGATSENGRIGYVAVTRAKLLFVLAVPEACSKEFQPDLAARGFVQVGA